jgi:8-oxo-dGTP pyrophosphatase MutT (NUDIX family)
LSAFTWPPESPGAAATPPAPTDQTQAAVLVPVFEVGGQPHIVLTRRRADLRRHAGEISFPGGRKDDEDRDLAETALREAEEEIGLARERVSLLGCLPTVSTFATGYAIHPYVGSIPAGLAWRLSAREVAQVLELSLAEVAAGRGKTQLERRGFTFETDAYIVGENVIWGATARIVEHLLGHLAPSNDGDPPALSTQE